MDGIACPHCTFINAPSKVKCGVCLRLLRKRERQIDSASVAEAKAGREESPPSLSSPHHEPLTRWGEGNSLEGVVSELDGHISSSPKTLALPECGRDARNHVHQSNSLEATSAATPLVPTFFSTASGRAVAVHRESIQRAAERLGDTVRPEMERVHTMFETAGGRAVTVQKRSLEKAKASFEDPEVEDAPSRSAHQPCHDPRGVSVTASSASLDSAAECSKPGLYSTEDETPKEGLVPSSEFPPNIGRVEAPAAELTSRKCDRSTFPPTTARGERRRGFVPPKQHSSARVHAKPLCAASSIKMTGLKALRFDPDCCTCRSIIPIPSLSSITSLTFWFKGSDCGRLLAGLLSVTEAETVQLGHWHAALLKLGASPIHCTVEWCRHALMSAMMQAHFMATAPSGTLSSAFSPVMILLCVMHLYNTEMVGGERPPLRKMLEGDISSASLVVLYMSSVSAERSSPHTRVVTLCDGVYHLKATCDVPLSNLIREGVLRPGQKMSVCGAQSLLRGQCAPTECDEKVVLSINYNCVRAVAQSTPLGVCHGEPLPLPLSLVHPLGGLVPAIEGVVARVLPSFFVSQDSVESHGSADGTRQVRERALRTVRNAHAQLQLSERLRTETEMLADGDSAESKPIARVTSLLVSKDGAEALVQQWETVDERSLLIDDDCGGMSLPVEGSWITLYAVNPAKSRTAAAPFTRAKLFYSSRKLHYVPSKKPLQHMRQILQVAMVDQCTAGVGDVADTCGLYLGCHRNEQGTFALLLLRDDTYALLQIPGPSAGRVLSLHMPTAERVPLVLLNATFLSAGDSVAGSDCMRLLANEYTTLLQRSTQTKLKTALEASSKLRGQLEISPQKYASRKAEVFLSLDEGRASSGLSLQNSAFLCNNGVAVAPEGTLDIRRHVPLASSSAPTMLPTSSQREGKLPYYLRQGGGSEKAVQLQGVRLPSASFHSPAEAAFVQHFQDTTAPHSYVREPQPTPLTSVVAASGSCHYGNIVDLVLLFDPRLYRRAWHPLTESLQASHVAGGRQDGESFRCVQLCWRVSADSAGNVTCRLGDRSTLGSVLESVCPLQGLCSVIADEHQIDVSLVRSERVLQWRRQDALSVWWRFFVDSRVLDSPADLDGASSDYLWWLPAEWAEAMRTVHTKLQDAFFFFVVNGEVLRHVRLISDCCNVAELPFE